LRAKCKKKAARLLPIHGPLRLSKILRSSKSTSDSDAIPLRRALLWLMVGVVLLIGLGLYFRYERLVVPLLS
jgi:hypothetical protein